METLKKLHSGWAIDFTETKAHPLYAEWLELILPYEREHCSIGEAPYRTDGRVSLCHKSDTGGSWSAAGTREQCEAEFEEFVQSYADFTIRFWLEKLDMVWKIGEPAEYGKFYIINGQSYCPHESSDSNKRGLGFGGRNFRFGDMEGNFLFESNNVWHQGVVPEPLREKWFPNSAQILPSAPC